MKPIKTIVRVNPLAPQDAWRCEKELLQGIIRSLQQDNESLNEKLAFFYRLTGTAVVVLIVLFYGLIFALTN